MTGGWVGRIIGAATLAAVGTFAPATAAPRHCYECHTQAEKDYKKSVVHKPVADKDCESCHKRHGFAQQLILQSNGPDLCTKCHSDFADKNIGSITHPAVAEGLCWTCHNPHASDHKGLLRDVDNKPACFVCHDEMQAPERQAEMHKPFADAKCEACHVPHSGDNPHLLVKSTENLCADCHDYNTEEFQKSHPVSTRLLACTDCHDPHNAAQKPLLSAGLHAPMADGDCSACHSSAGPSKADLADAVPALCYTCHDDVQADIGSAHAHPPAAEGDCTGCHEAHSSRHDALLTGTQAKLCGNCHESKIDSTQIARHAPYVDGECSKCHQPHGSANATLLEAGDNSLCTSCHSDSMFTAPEHAAAADDCRTCHAPHTGARLSLLTEDGQTLCKACHEVDTGKKFTHEPYNRGVCATCHAPHSGQQPHLVRAQSEQLCVGCHINIQRFLAMPVKHEPAAACETCHEPHNSDNANLLTRPSSEVCANCHEAEALPVGGVSHKPYADKDCAACHNPHGSARENLLGPRRQMVSTPAGDVLKYPQIDSTRSSLCKVCHADRVVVWDSMKVVHTPVKRGECATCHASHTGQKGLLSDYVDNLCARCHEAGPTFTQKHRGADMAGANCVDCHNPHASDEPGLLNPVKHPPFADGDCSTCHNEDAGKVQRTLAAPTAELCANCHENYAASGEDIVVHAPVEAAECGSCHSPHAGVEAKLLRAKGPALCADCHEIRTDGTVVHKPVAEGQCLACHPAHNSVGKRLTMRQGSSLCATCHTDLAERLKTQTVHAPVADDCSTCHTPHSGDQEHLLAKPEAQLCASCHPRNEAWKEKHLGGKVDGGCTTCHDPHAAPKGQKALLYKFTHKPFTDGNCTSCHGEPAAAPESKCQTCHAPIVNAALKAKSPHPPASQKECAACHRPHAAPATKLLPGDGVKTCKPCHQDVVKHAQFVHSPRSECETCHAPHGNDNTGMLIETNEIELCVTCHDGVIERHYHPMGDKATNPRTKGPLMCSGCHDPHRSDHKAMLIADPGRGLCVLCHELDH